MLGAPLGEADAPVPPHRRVPLAGGAHGPRDGEGSGRGDDADARGLPRGGGEGALPPGCRGPQERVREVRGSGGDLLHRGDDAGQEGAAGGHLALPGAEFRQGLRRAVPDPRGKARLRLGDELGRIHPPHRRGDHDALGRQGTRTAARLGPGPGCHRSDLQDRDQGRRARLLREALGRAQGGGGPRDAGCGRVEEPRLEVRRARDERGAAPHRDRAAGHGGGGRRWSPAAIPGEKAAYEVASLPVKASELLDAIQKNLYDRALAFRKENTKPVATREELLAFYGKDRGEDAGTAGALGGFAEGLWCGDAACEAQLKAETKVTIRCLPLDRQEGVHGSCCLCGKPAKHLAVFARNY